MSKVLLKDISDVLFFCIFYRKSMECHLLINKSKNVINNMIRASKSQFIK